MIKVLHIIDSLVGGGKERQLVEFLKALDSSEIVTNEVILLKDINQYPETNSLKTKIHVFRRRIKKDPTIYFKIGKVVKQFSPDILFSWGSMPSIYAIPFTLSGKVKFINFSIQDGFCPIFSQGWRRSKLTFPFSDVIVSNSYAGIEAYPAKLDKSKVIYNGVHLDRFGKLKTKDEIRSKFSINKTFLVGMVGAFHPRKDWKTFCDAAKLVISERSDICFLAIGDGKDLNYYKNYMSTISDESFKFLGRQDDIESIVNSLDVCVLSTNTDVHREGIANVIVEYMGLGKPVVATMGGGTPEIVDNNYTGRIVEPHDASALKSGIQFFLNNPSVAKLFGERAKEKVKNGYTIDLMIESFVNLIQNLKDQTK